jgi:glycosyltransferase involved in cell wall biosynthesis
MSPVLYNWETEEPLCNPYFYKIKKHLFSKLGTFSEESFISTYLSTFLKKHKIQVVLAEFGPVGENVVGACEIAKIPLVVHFHGDDAHKKEYINRYNGYQKLVKYAKEVVCVSSTMKEQLTRIGFSNQQLHLIPYGIDVSFFSGGNSATSAPVFLAVGRFVDKKAPHLSILAFEKVLKKVPDAHLIMIGAGPLLSACKALVQSLGITAQVDFKGICTPNEVQQYMKNARAFLMHSVTPETGEKEGTPVSILEASASGLPVISTFHAGISEAVLHEKTGFLVNEYDIEKMSCYMIKLAENPSLAQQMGEAGKKHIKASYSLHQQTNKLADVIRSCVA